MIKKFKNAKELKEQVKNNKIMLASEGYRHSTISTIKQENIAEHSAYVAYYSFVIAKEVVGLSNYLCYKVAFYGLIHDLAETAISDIPSNIKYSIDGFKEMIDKAEAKAVDQFYPEISNEFLQLQKDEQEKMLLGVIVKLADILSFLYFCDSEIEYGNKHKNLLKSYESQEEKLEEYFNLLEKIMNNEEK